MESGRVIEVGVDEFEDPWAGMTIPEIKARDEYREGVIERLSIERQNGQVERMTITYDNGLTLGISRDRCGENLEKIDPQQGKSVVRVYGKGFGSTFHGVDIDGVEMFWRTPMERDLDRLEWLAEHDREQREEFAQRKERLDRDYAALPEPLKCRIDRFRDADPGFRVTSEGYELFCCTEAAKFAERAQRAADHAGEALYNDQFVEVMKFFEKPGRKDGEKVWDVPRPDDPAEAWMLWAWAVGTTDEYDYDQKRQRELLGHSPDHSGNTFGGACTLALALLRGEKV